MAVSSSAPGSVRNGRLMDIVPVRPCWKIVTGSAMRGVTVMTFPIRPDAAGGGAAKARVAPSTSVPPTKAFK